MGFIPDVRKYIESVPDATYNKISSIRFNTATDEVEIVYE